jgi:anthranilate synthase component II
VRVLVVDNYDSFAWNLVQALGSLGADVVVRRNDAVSVEEALALGRDAIVISPGPCTPEVAGISVELVGAAAELRRPVLGVCLGHQAIGVAFGGRVVRGERPVHGKTSLVRHDGAGVYRGLPATFSAMRYHSLVVAEPLPEALVATARSDDGALMGLRHRGLPIEGVQFHPESFLTPDGPPLLANFLAIAREANLRR